MANYSYFKFRKRFDFNAHPYEIGNFMIFNKKIEDNFFFNKLFEIQENEHIPFFNFHQQHFLLKYPEEEQQFLSHLLEVVQKRIDYYTRQDVFTDAEKTLFRLSILTAFQKALDELNIWNLNKNLEVLLANKEIEIASYKKEVEELKNIIKTAGKYDAESKIRIMEGTLPALIDLVQQMRVLTLPDGRKFCSVQSQSAWYKMIAKYFQNGEKDIPIDTLRNYFPAGKPEGMSKGSEVSKANKLFRIEAINTPKT